MKSTLKERCVMALGAALTVLIMAGAAQAETVWGASQPMGEGSVRSYVTLDNSGTVSEIGIAFSEAALTGLPHEAEYNLALPPQASSTPFTHVGLNWNAHGHEPEPIYGDPHFDAHFYTITQAERQQITATDADQERAYRTPEPELIPAGYVLAPDSAMPTQGTHWVNPGSDEFQGDPHGFDQTFIYGFYDGRITFLEPMISMDVLARRQSFTQPISIPAQYAKPGAYPTEYALTYDAQAHEYRLSLTGLMPSE